MSGRFVRASSYRHTHGEPAKPEKQFLDVRPQCNGDGNYITANELFFAYAGAGGGGPVVVHPHTKPGRIAPNNPKLLVHKGAVNDFQFHPFIPTLLGTASEDCYAKISQIPEEGLTENITEAVVSLEGHQKKVTLMQFHPTANNILSTTSADNTLKIWDIEKQAEALSFDEFGSTVHSFDWNEEGSLLATTSQDKVLRIYDPRDNNSVQKTAGFDGNKASRVVWVNNYGKLAVVGFTRSSMRQYALYDPKKFDKPMVATDIDQSAGVLMPFYDPDNSILYIAGKGDASIKYFEIVDTEPYVHFLSEFRDTNSQKGLCFLPKRAVDVKSCEIAHALRLMKDSIVPISFTVPRKSELFQADLFPDTYAGVPSLDAKEWFGGENKAPQKVSMKPGTQSASTKLEFKAKPSPAELEAELAKAHAKIKELEAELAKLKA